MTEYKLTEVCDKKVVSQFSEIFNDMRNMYYNCLESMFPLFYVLNKKGTILLPNENSTIVNIDTDTKENRHVFVGSVSRYCNFETSNSNHEQYNNLKKYEVLYRDIIWDLIEYSKYIILENNPTPPDNCSKKIFREDSILIFNKFKKINNNIKKFTEICEWKYILSEEDKKIIKDFLNCAEFCMNIHRKQKIPNILFDNEDYTLIYRAIINDRHDIIQWLLENKKYIETETHNIGQDEFFNNNILYKLVTLFYGNYHIFDGKKGNIDRIDYIKIIKNLEVYKILITDTE